MEFVVKDELLNSILAYLGTKPFSEVAGLVQAIHQGASPHGEIIHEEKAVSGNDQEG